MACFGLASLLLGSDKKGSNEANLMCYTSACEEDPLLKSFGSSLDQQFSKLKSSLAPTENCALNSAKSVCGFLADMNQNLADNIIANLDVFKDKELMSLVDLYYESSTTTLDLFNTVGNCTKKAKSSILAIRIAIQKFDKESMAGGNLKYAETLENLNKVKAMGDPFGDEYKNQLEWVREEQLMVLKKFKETLKKIEKKQKKLKRRRRMAIMVLATVALSFVVLEIYVCMHFPPLAVVSTAVGAATGLCNLIAPIKKLVKEMRKVDRMKEVVKTMKDTTDVNIQGTNTINSLVVELTNSLSSILGAVDDAVADRQMEVVKPAMEAIRDEVDMFAKTIKEVSEAVAMCSSNVVSGKLQVLEHITNSLSSKKK